MFSQIIVLALAASPLVAAHGKIAVASGDMGGNTTGLGILGGIVPGPGKNAVTEVDTTVFKSKNAMTDGLGKTKKGANTLAGMAAVMAQSGSTLPQVAPGGTLTATMHFVTDDGAGPYTVVVDPTGTGAFASGTKAVVTKQVPGKNGNIDAKKARFVTRMLVAAGIIQKRAANVNKDFQLQATIPAGTQCTGTVGGQSNVCLVKIVNPSGAGPFGGVIGIQMAGAGAAAAPATGATTATTPATAEVATKDAKKAKKPAAAKRELVGAKFRA